MKWFLSAVHLFPPSSSSLFRIAARVSLRGAGSMGPMDGTEKFRLGAGSQVACMLLVHTLSYLFHLVVRFSGRSTLVTFSIFHHRALLSSLSIYHCLLLSFSAKKLTKEQPFEQLPSRVQTTLTGTQVTVVRIAADTHASRGYPAGTMHRTSVYRV